MMKVPFLDLAAMHDSLVDEAVGAIEAIIRKNAFVLGEDVGKFEEEFAAYCGSKYAVGVDSGLSALSLALLAYGLEPGDEAIIPANTFIATAAAAVFVGVKPVFVDVVPGTYNIDPAQLESALTPRTKAVIPVHLYGKPADMDPIMAFAEKHNLLVLEDASQAHGARYNGRRVGTFGHIAAFSLYPGKNLGAFGDAGVVTTDDAAVVERIKAMRNCGQLVKYHHEYHPYNHRLDTIQAAVLRIKLRKLDEWNESRRQAAAWYTQLLAGTHVITPVTPDNMEPVWHLYVIRTPHRDALAAFLKERGIGTAIHYPIPVHLAPVYAHMNYKRGDFPITESEADMILSLPIFPNMTFEQVEYVAENIKLFEKELAQETAQ